MNRRASNKTQILEGRNKNFSDVRTELAMDWTWWGSSPTSSWGGAFKLKRFLSLKNLRLLCFCCFSVNHRTLFLIFMNSRPKDADNERECVFWTSREDETVGMQNCLDSETTWLIWVTGTWCETWRDRMLHTSLPRLRSSQRYVSEDALETVEAWPHLLPSISRKISRWTFSDIFKWIKNYI